MKIVFACGGTGGHIFPAFSVAEELKKRDPRTEIIYVCGKKDIEHAIFKIVAGEKVVPIESAMFGGALSLFNPSFLIKLFSGFRQANGFLKKEKPDLVVGFGGYFSFPAVFIAKWLNIRTLIHEQNAVPGMANKFLSRFVDGIALSFPDTAEHLSGKNRFRVTGNPVRASIENVSREEALRFFNFSGDKITILVLGGSQGSESINGFFLEAMNFIAEDLMARIQVLHLCGKMPIEATESAFSKFGVAGKAYSFFERMDLAYGATDIAIGRAGATFLAEIAVKNIPAILIPYPYGSGHQLVNAKAFGRTRDSVLIEQKDLTPESLAGRLVEYIQKVEENRRDHRFAKPDRSESSNARELLADFIEETIQRK